MLNIPSVDSCLDDVSVDETEEEEEDENKKTWLEDVYLVMGEVGGGLQAKEILVALKCEVLRAWDIKTVVQRRVECDHIELDIR